MNNYMKIINSLRLFLIIGIAALGLLVIQSCEKPEGEGGASSITGKVIVREYNSDFSELKKEYYAQEERVYIIYGNDPTHSDDVRTNYDGTYRFSYLRKGTYHVFAYSEDTAGTSISGIVPIIKTVKIGSNNEHVTAEDIIIID